VDLVTTNMAKKQRPKGRPKGAGRITFRYGIVATNEYRGWMDDFMAAIGETEVSDVFREAVKRLAESKGFRPPPKR
jgi:hypothetical protein